jgi:hypothetical protein
MTAQDTTITVEHKPVLERAAVWLWLSIGGALLAVVGSVVALAAPSVYARVAPTLLWQALAQDVANLAVASPALLITAALALRGSLHAYLLWLGVVTFTVYSYVIYTFSFPFGSLFLLWVAVLGLCMYALIGGLAAVDSSAVAARYTSRRAAVVVAWFLIVTGVLIGLLWLSEDIPALLAGVTPQSLIDEGLPTNPVHVLDYAFFLPAVIATGVLLLKRKPLSYTLAPALLVLLIMTGVPALLTPVVQAARGATPAWAVVVPVGALTAASLGLLAWLLSTVRAR